MKLEEIFKYALASLIIIGFFVLLVVLATLVVPEANAKLLDMCVGALIAAFSMIVGYFFGSSLGSKLKTELMTKAELMAKANMVDDKQEITNQNG